MREEVRLLLIVKVVLLLLVQLVGVDWTHIWVHRIPPANVLKLLNFKGLLDEDILHIVGEKVDLKLIAFVVFGSLQLDFKL